MTHQASSRRLWPHQGLGFLMLMPWTHHFACIGKAFYACALLLARIPSIHTETYFRASRTPLASGNNLGSSLVVYISHLQHQGGILTKWHKMQSGEAGIGTSVTGTGTPPEWPQCVVKIENH